MMDVLLQAITDRVAATIRQLDEIEFSAARALNSECNAIEWRDGVTVMRASLRNIERCRQSAHEAVASIATLIDGHNQDEAELEEEALYGGG